MKPLLPYYLIDLEIDDGADDTSKEDNDPIKEKTLYTLPSTPHVQRSMTPVPARDLTLKSEAAIVWDAALPNIKVLSQPTPECDISPIQFALDL